MHSEHRRRYHLRPLSDVHPGDRVSRDAAAIAALVDGRPDDVDWDEIHVQASQVLVRTRQTQTQLSLQVRDPRGPARITDHVDTPLLLAKSENSF